MLEFWIQIHVPRNGPALGRSSYGILLQEGSCCPRLSDVVVNWSSEHGDCTSILHLQITLRRNPVYDRMWFLQGLVPWQVIIYIYYGDFWSVCIIFWEVFQRLTAYCTFAVYIWIAIRARPLEEEGGVKYSWLGYDIFVNSSKRFSQLNTQLIVWMWVSIILYVSINIFAHCFIPRNPNIIV